MVKYATHTDLLEGVRELAAERRTVLRSELTVRLAGAIRRERAAVIQLSKLSDANLAELFLTRPLLFKPLLALANIASRSIARDLQLSNINTYAPRLNNETSMAIARYVRPFLPERVSVDALLTLDYHCYVDKEIRAGKGRWEDQVRTALIDQSGREFKKRLLRMTSRSGRFSVDAVYPPDGPVLKAVDVKRVEAARDIDKRSEEIIGHAQKVKRMNRSATFAAVLYIPNPHWQRNMRELLKESDVDLIVFAGTDRRSIARAAKRVLSRFRLLTAAS